MIDAELAEAEASGAAKLNSSNDAPMDVGGFKDSDNEDDGPAQLASEPATRAPRRPAAPAAGVATAAAAAMSSAASALWGGKPEDAAQNVSRQQSPAQTPPSVPARSSAAAAAPPAAKAPYVSRNRHGPPRSAAPSPIPPKVPLKRRPIPDEEDPSRPMPPIPSPPPIVIKKKETNTSSAVLMVMLKQAILGAFRLSNLPLLPTLSVLYLSSATEQMSA